MSVYTEPVSEIPPTSGILFPEHPIVDGYKTIPDNPEELIKFLNHSDRDGIYSLDELQNIDLNKLFNQYFKPTQGNSMNLQSIPKGFVRLFRGEGDRGQYLTGLTQLTH